MNDNLGEIIIYQTDDGLTKIETKFEKDTVWLSLDQMAELFQRDKSTISRHIKNVFEEGELEKNSVVANYATTAADGKIYNVDYFNLDVIISVGYRVKSLRGTQFRRWATDHLKEYLIKGFTMDDERLKENAGTVSHDVAIKKAETEYKKYQSTVLSPVEEAYIATIRDMNATIKKGTRKK